MNRIKKIYHIFNMLYYFAASFLFTYLGLGLYMPQPLAFLIAIVLTYGVLFTMIGEIPGVFNSQLDLSRKSFIVAKIIFQWVYLHQLFPCVKKYFYWIVFGMVTYLWIFEFYTYFYVKHDIEDAAACEAG